MNTIEEIMNIMNQPSHQIQPTNIPMIEISTLPNPFPHPSLAGMPTGLNISQTQNVEGFNITNSNLFSGINDIGSSLLSNVQSTSGLENITSLLTNKLNEYNFSSDHLDILRKNKESKNVTLEEIYIVKNKFDKLKGKTVNLDTLCKNTPHLLEEIQLHLKKTETKHNAPIKQSKIPDPVSVTTLKQNEGVIKSFYDIIAERGYTQQNPDPITKSTEPVNADDTNKNKRISRDILKIILDEILDKYLKLEQTQKFKEQIDTIKKELVTSLDKYCYWSDKFTKIQKLKDKITKWNQEYYEMERDCVSYLETNKEYNGEPISKPKTIEEYSLSLEKKDLIDKNKPLATNLLQLRDTNFEAIGKILDELDVQEIKDNLVKHIQNFSHYYGLAKNIISLHEQPICNICLTDVINTVLTPCGHTGCNQCIEKAGPSCSICRQMYQKASPIYF